MSDNASFNNFVPGFEFLQGLLKNAGTALPHIGQWVAPTINPEELEKRINELRTVQFWLEQNARVLSATIQALEVQRMTLSTLRTMNVRMGDLRDSLSIRPSAGEKTPRSATAPFGEAPASAATENAEPMSVVDPMQWWSALTRQFTQLAATAMEEHFPDARKAAEGTPPSASHENVPPMQPTEPASKVEPKAVAPKPGALKAGEQPVNDPQVGDSKSARKRSPPRESP